MATPRELVAQAQAALRALDAAVTPSAPAFADATLDAFGCIVDGCRAAAWVLQRVAEDIDSFTAPDPAPTGPPV